MNRWQLALAGLALFGVGGMIGAAVATKPAPAVTTSHTQQDATMSVIQRHEERANEAVKVTQVLPPQRVVTERVVYRDKSAGGCAVAESTKTITDTGTGSTITESTKATEANTATEAKERIVTAHDTKTVTLAPQWSVTVMPGLSLSEPAIALPSVSRVVLGVSVERHIVGPFSAGVWINSVGAAGVSVGAKW